MYTIFHTDAIVLGGQDRGEASRTLALFTREHGLIHAHTQGLRELKSKLRYALQDFSCAHVNLVHGKNGWKVTSAIHKRSFLPGGEEKARLGAIVRVSKLLRRLLPGEEKNETLYDEILETFSVIKNTPLSAEYVFNIEVILVMRILALLGYWGDDARFAPFLEKGTTREELLQQMMNIKPFAIREINKALKETQL
ncbi:MAG: recombination protein O N-terminal domain-containing protein [Parcubacteria group bacterium]|nr:recombination protein O N-terminal domain-containing protein [Parcubacteria group bacterium]